MIERSSTSTVAKPHYALKPMLPVEGANHRTRCCKFNGTAIPQLGQKTRIQMTRAELPVVAAVLLGARQSCEFSSHGADKTKGFSMERQGTKVFTKVFEKGAGVKAVPMEAADAFFVTSLFLLQIRKISPWLDASSAIALVRSTMHMQNAT